VTSTHIVDTDREPLPFNREEGDSLQLVTCYPFDSLRPGGPMRYVVSARPYVPVAPQG
jgi:sortase A